MSFSVQCSLLDLVIYLPISIFFAHLFIYLLTTYNSFFSKLQNIKIKLPEMKNRLLLLVVMIIVIASGCNKEQNSWVRINQLGYRSNDIKVAVFISNKPIDLESFKVIDVNTGKVVMTIKNVKSSLIRQMYQIFSQTFPNLVIITQLYKILKWILS